MRPAGRSLETPGLLERCNNMEVVSSSLECRAPNQGPNYLSSRVALNKDSKALYRPIYPRRTLEGKPNRRRKTPLRVELRLETGTWNPRS